MVILLSRGDCQDGLFLPDASINGSVNLSDFICGASTPCKLRLMRGAGVGD